MWPKTPARLQCSFCQDNYQWNDDNHSAHFLWYPATATNLSFRLYEVYVVEVSMRRFVPYIQEYNFISCQSQWPRGPIRRSTAARLLRCWFRIRPGGMDVCLLCVLSGRGLWDELITRSEGSYRLWRVVVCDHKTLWYEEAIARAGLQSQKKKLFIS
jgi:hypothetical protein